MALQHAHLAAGRLHGQSGHGPTVYHSAGLYWTPKVHGTYEVARVWQPNVVPQTVQRVSYLPQVVSQQVPVQVCRYQPEQVCRKVPYQTCKIVQEQCVRMVPYTVCKPVVERVEQQVPVQVCHMVTQECVRRVPVETCKMTYEEHADRVPYQVCRMEAYQVTLQIPHCVEKQIPVTYTCTVPHTVCCRVPINAGGQTLDEALVPTVTGPTRGVPTRAAKPAVPPVPTQPGGAVMTALPPAGQQHSTDRLT